MALRPLCLLGLALLPGHAATPRATPAPPHRLEAGVPVTPVPEAREPSVAKPPPRPPPAGEAPYLVFEGDRCFLGVGDFEINIPRAKIAWTYGPRGPLAEIAYLDPRDSTRRTVRIPVGEEEAPPPPPECLGARLR